MVDEFAVLDDGDLAVHVESKFSSIVRKVLGRVCLVRFIDESLVWRVSNLRILGESDMGWHGG